VAFGNLFTFIFYFNLKVLILTTKQIYWIIESITQLNAFNSKIYLLDVKNYRFEPKSLFTSSNTTLSIPSLTNVITVRYDISGIKKESKMNL